MNFADRCGLKAALMTVAAVSSSLCLPQAAIAQDANFYLTGCSAFVREGDPDRDKYLLRQQGYCIGVIETLMMHPNGQFCPPHGQITRTGAIFIVLGFAQGRKDLTRPLPEIVLQAFMAKWPCRANDG